MAIQNIDVADKATLDGVKVKTDLIGTATDTGGSATAGTVMGKLNRVIETAQSPQFLNGASQPIYSVNEQKSFYKNTFAQSSAVLADGENGCIYATATDGLYKIDVETGIKTLLTSDIVAGSGIAITMCCENGVIYCLVGAAANKELKYYNTRTNTIGTIANHSISGQIFPKVANGMTIDNGILYFWGCQTASSTYNGTSAKYNITTDSWGTLTTLPSGSNELSQISYIPGIGVGFKWSSSCSATLDNGQSYIAPVEGTLGYYLANNMSGSENSHYTGVDVVKVPSDASGRVFYNSSGRRYYPKGGLTNDAITLNTRYENSYLIDGQSNMKTSMVFNGALYLIRLYVSSGTYYPNSLVCYNFKVSQTSANEALNQLFRLKKGNEILTDGLVYSYDTEEYLIGTHSVTPELALYTIPADGAYMICGYVQYAIT